MVGPGQSPDEAPGSGCSTVYPPRKVSPSHSKGLKAVSEPFRGSESAGKKLPVARVHRPRNPTQGCHVPGVGYTEAQIVDILAQAAKGEMTAIEVCRINGISEQTFYRWKRRYGDMQVSEVRRLRELEAENARLKRLLTERDLEIDAIKDVLRE